MNVFPLKMPQRLCSNCENAFLGSRGVFCAEFDEHINNERVAEECEAYEPFTNFTLREEKKVPARISLEQTAEAYLANLDTDTWGQIFVPKDPASRREAARWLASEIRALWSDK